MGIDMAKAAQQGTEQHEKRDRAALAREIAKNEAHGAANRREAEKIRKEETAKRKNLPRGGHK